VTKRFFPQGEQQSATPYYYTFDHEGSVRELCNSSGTIVARYNYDPYGRTTLVSGTNIATFQYAGYYQHQPSGLNLTLYRAYDAATGKWLGRDPLGEEQGSNLYNYVGNDPLDWYDPLGLSPQGRGIHHAPPGQYLPMPVDPNHSDFPFLFNLNNFQWYGNWGGPHVTSGSRFWAEADNFPDDPNDPRFRAPKDARDTCYYHHDVCLHNCGTIKDPALRLKCRAGCDHSLGSCLCQAVRGCPKSRHGPRRKNFCLGARSRARSIAGVLRDERATQPQGKRTSVRRVTSNLGRSLRGSLLTDHCEYARRSRLDSTQIRLVTRPMPTFRTASSLSFARLVATVKK